MRRLLLVVTVALVMVAMLAVPAMAKGPAPNSTPAKTCAAIAGGNQNYVYPTEEGLVCRFVEPETGEWLEYPLQTD